MVKNIPSNSAQGTLIDLFALSSADIESISSDFKENCHYVSITLKADYPPCPDCGTEHPSIKNYVTKKIDHEVVKESGCILLYNARRYKCPFCGRTYYEKNPFAFARRRISHRLILQVLEALRDPGTTFSAAARSNNISPTTAQSIFDQYVEYPKPSTLPKILLMDEVYAYRSDESKYVCVLLDYDKMHPTDLLPSRKKEVLDDYFREYPLAERKKVLYFASDMYEGYRSAARRWLPNATIATDRYHVSQEFSRRVTQLRIRWMKGCRPGTEGYYLLKHHHELLNIRPDAVYRKKDGPQEATKELVLDPNGPRSYNKFYKRKMNKFELQTRLLAMFPELQTAYDLKNELGDLFRKETLETAEKRLGELITSLERSRITELTKFAGTLRSWYREIINSFHIVKQDIMVSGKTGGMYVVDHHLTSSLAENRNKILKQLKVCANGYGCWERFRNRGLYVMDPAPVLRSVPIKSKKNNK